MATPVKNFTYLSTLETLAPLLKAPQRLNLRAMMERGMRQPPPLWRPLSLGAAQTQAPLLKAPQRLNLRAMVERIMTLFWRGSARRGWQIYPSGRNR